MIEIIGRKETRTIKKLSGERRLLALLQEEGLAPSAPCGGRGVCGRCRVRFLEGATEPTEQERKLLTKDELADGVRLACEARVSAPCRIRIEPDDKNLAVLLDGEEGAPVSSVVGDSRAEGSEAKGEQEGGQTARLGPSTRNRTPGVDRRTKHLIGGETRLREPPDQQPENLTYWNQACFLSMYCLITKQGHGYCFYFYSYV